jgi:hypothetical protein
MTTKTLRIAALLSCAFFIGCAENRFPRIAPATDADRAEADAPFYCSDAEHCAFAWRKTQFWIAENSRTRLQVVTDVVVQSYATGSLVTGWSFTATRQPSKSGRDVIDLTASCVGIQCTENPVAVVARFKRYLRAAE